MYGRTYQEWVERDAVAVKIDGFLAGLPQDERVVALAILRERHVVYKDNPFSGRAQSQASQMSAAPLVPYAGSPPPFFGNILGSIF